MAFVEISHVTKRFGEKVALSDLCLTLEKGELFVFLGPNGAGKTTTIKLLSGLLFPTEGTIRIGGHDVVREHHKIKPFFSYIPDEPYLYDKLTGREFLHFVGEMYGLDREECCSAIEELTERFGARDYMDHLAETYSHGMKQRIVIVSMLLQKPKMVVIDEPMVGLDPPTVRLFKETLRQLAEQGTTIFLSTHTLSVAEELAHRVGILHRGKLIALGTLEELRTHYRLDSQASLEELFLKATDWKAPQ